MLWASLRLERGGSWIPGDGTRGQRSDHTGSLKPIHSLDVTRGQCDAAGSPWVTKEPKLQGNMVAVVQLDA